MAADLGATVIAEPEKIEITPEMIEAGEQAIKEEIGDPDDVSGYFMASALATKVYLAMKYADRTSRCL